MSIMGQKVISLNLQQVDDVATDACLVYRNPYLQKVIHGFFSQVDQFTMKVESRLNNNERIHADDINLAQALRDFHSDCYELFYSDMGIYQINSLRDIPRRTRSIEPRAVCVGYGLGASVPQLAVGLSFPSDHMIRYPGLSMLALVGLPMLGGLTCSGFSLTATRHYIIKTQEDAYFSQLEREEAVNDIFQATPLVRAMYESDVDGHNGTLMGFLNNIKGREQVLFEIANHDPNTVIIDIRERL